ncbi:DUF2790 domain-containing protein [Pseudomonas gingeri]|uniref:DUF2790 domain-containing protein n=1 Tax=Pseudomonas gingeri TaxID=117681 RepID=A0A7Y7Y9J8_9PSED|nr:DUF2790 domain-containing protein [Pseudomonas gingeri]NWA02086.1 DUF2790 domain-containing protein [Pseudomonas gingeri]NWA18121.1 DUF2790 domain-containing protein [Pseudomonas gingeri]NWA56298.1 DUF2790 domain-containing protein [Pseudomonas gingeri]NWA98876.1 DUF2790 domain-containing protein [Pseudomonas gingeri]NWB04805.1 DUF2790 domain-containing protein [Pseudomonas gingeri]
MKLKALCTAGLFSALSILAVVAPAQASAHSASAKPDIQHVLSVVTDGTGNCGVVNAHMTYLDSRGQQGTFDYRKFADCDQGN